MPAFEHLVARLLRATGYDQVQVLQVQVLAGSQGGADLSASIPSGLSQCTTLVQAKQYRTPVSRRFVDELRGAMLREGAQQGVLLTTSTFYLPAYRAVWKPCPLSVRLVDGSELTDLLLARNLGVQPAARGRQKLDRPFFANLRREHGSSLRAQRPSAARAVRQAVRPATRAIDDRPAPRPKRGESRRSWLDTFLEA